MTRTERQNLAIEKWKAYKCKGTIVAATGVGKTTIALMAIGRVLKKYPEIIVRIIVPTVVLKSQWEEKIESFQLEGNIQVLVLNTAARTPFKCDFLVLDKFASCPV